MSAVKPEKQKRLPRAVREQQMLDAAVTVFSRHGYHAASMDGVAELAGISKPMVYAYLGPKEDVFVACIRREATRLAEAIVTVVAKYPDIAPDERLWRGLQAFFRFVGDHRDSWAVLYRQARTREPFAGEIAAMRATIAQVVSGLLDETIRASEARHKPRDVESMAYALIGACESLADWLLDHPDQDPERTAAQLMGLIWAGADTLLRGGTWRPPSSSPSSSPPSSPPSPPLG